MSERKQPDACKLVRFDGWEIRVVERTTYDAAHNPQYSYEPMLRRKQTRGWFERFVGRMMTGTNRRFSLAGSPDSPLIFVDPDEALYAAIVAAWRWRVSMQRHDDDRIM